MASNDTVIIDRSYVDNFSMKKYTEEQLVDKYFEDIHKLDFTYWNKEIRFTTSISSSIVNLDRKVITDLINAYEAD